jgi:glycosyltransferase involved in cell wall biosynthesis
MRVAFIVSEWVHANRPLHGIFFRDQALALRDAGVRVDVVYVEPRSLRDLSMSGIRESHFQVTAMPEDGLFTIRRRAWNPNLRSATGAAIWRKMTENLFDWYVDRYGRPDLVHAHNTVWAGCIARNVCLKHALPYVLSEHSSIFLMNGIAESMARRLGRALASAARITAVSAPLRAAMRPYVETSRVRIIPNMVDTGFFVPPGARRPGRPFTFAAIAHLNENKGHETLLRAFAHAFGSGDDPRLIIAGDGPERSRLQALAGELNLESRVTFPGYLDRASVRDLLQRADALVHPSYHETFGIILIEALATGLPVIATRSGGPAEIVDDRNGLLVEPGDVAQLAAALSATRVARYDPAAIRSLAEERYSAAAVVKSIMDVYHEALTNG